jgi:ABC-type multidrug transport system ATPase subunit
MDVSLHAAGKRFNQDWIFRKLDLELRQGDSLAVLGGNGSGKSTLLRVISGIMGISEGAIAYQSEGVSIAPEAVYRDVSIAAPYLELPGLYTLEESLEFHFRFKKPKQGMKLESMLERSGLAAHRKKFVYHFSSGMKQRLKLCLAFFSDTSLLLLDEPLSNLDSSAIDWYREILPEFSNDRTLVVCSNHDTREFELCQSVLEIRKP